MADEVKVIDEWPTEPDSDARGDTRYRVRDLMALGGHCVLEWGYPSDADGGEMRWHSIAPGLRLVHRAVAGRLSALLAERRQESEPEGGR